MYSSHNSVSETPAIVYRTVWTKRRVLKHFHTLKSISGILSRIIFKYFVIVVAFRGGVTYRPLHLRQIWFFRIVPFLQLFKSLFLKLCFPCFNACPIYTAWRILRHAKPNLKATAQPTWSSPLLLASFVYSTVVEWTIRTSAQFSALHQTLQLVHCLRQPDDTLNHDLIPVRRWCREIYNQNLSPVPQLSCSVECDSHALLLSGMPFFITRTAKQCLYDHFIRGPCACSRHILSREFRYCSCHFSSAACKLDPFETWSTEHQTPIS